MAQIQKRNNSYFITVNLGYDSKGNRIRKTTTYKPKASTPKAIEKEVNQFAYDFENKVKNGMETGYNVTFEEYVNNIWLEYKKARLTERIYEDYKSSLKRWVIPYIGYMKMTKIKGVHCDMIFSEMNKQGKAPSTIKKIKTILSSVFHYAYKTEVISDIPTNHCLNVPIIEKSEKVEHFTEEQTKNFLTALTLEYENTRHKHKSHNRITGKEMTIKEYTQKSTISLQFQLYYNLALASGLRLGEMISLTWNDIEQTKEGNIIIHVRHSTQYLKGKGQYLKEPKTKAGKRDVPITSKKCIEMLELWHNQEMHKSEELGTAWQGHKGKDFDNSFIFIQATGKQMDLKTPYHKFHEIIGKFNKRLDSMSLGNPQMKDTYESMKLPYIRLHCLRHTTATMMLSGTRDIESVSALLGHSKVSLTLDTYGHALQKNTIKASEKMAILIDSK